MRARVGMMAAVLAAATAAAGLGTGLAAGYTVGTGTATIQGAQQRVLTDANGMTLYYFAADTANRSACTGGCAATWPALTSDAPPTAEDSLPGKLTVVRTANGSQVAYNGHLLYRYAGDTAPGQANGHGIAGKWWAANVTLKPATVAPAPPSGGYSGNTGGGYGGNQGGSQGGGGMGGSHY